MRSIQGALYLEFGDLVRAGIKPGTIKAAKHHGYQGWTFMPDPQDKRRVLVCHESLKPQVKAVVDVVLADELAGAALADIRALVQVLPADVQALRDHRYGEGQSLPADHIEKYARAAAYLRLLHTADRATMKRVGCATAVDWHSRVITCIKVEGLDLPTTYGKLRERVRRFASDGITAVISGRFGNQNSRKITEAVNAWLVSQYALPTKPDVMQVAIRYQAIAPTKGWPSLTPSAVYHHLHREEVEQLWYLGRHGKAAWQSKYGHTLKLRPASFRDALWIGDGTKVNLFYQGAKGVTADMQLYIIIDAYSCAIIGWSLGKVENTAMQYEAAKMALTYSQAKPMQWLYDNQGGHVGIAGKDFYDRAAKLHFPSQPYNPKGKPVERVLGEFQKQVLRSHWAFTGFNLPTHGNIESAPNKEYILAHKKELPQLHELPQLIGSAIDTWNAGTNKQLGMARIAAYDASVNPFIEEQRIDTMDMVELFWQRTKEITYRKEGIAVTIGEIVQLFEVYDKDGNPDEAFRARYLNARFVVRYDRDALDYICLYRVDESGDLRFVTVAQPKQSVARAVVDMQPGDRAIIAQSLELRTREIKRAADRLKVLQEKSEVDPETLVQMAAFGAPKQDVNSAEASLYVQGMRPAPRHMQEDEDGPGISPYDV